MSDDVFILAWCGSVLGSAPKRVLFRSGHLSAVLGVELDDGRSVVVKVFNAKKDAADGGGPQLVRLAGEMGERMSRAGLDVVTPLGL
ncbi:MAG: hypothetical protein ACRDN0_07885 [Trebonia sp.]